MSERERKPQTLRRKLFLARRAAEAVAKDGHSSDGGFDYARFEDVLAEASKQLEKRDIFYLSSMVDEELTIGKQGVIAKSVIEYEVTDTKTGESLTVRWAGTGHDIPGDKALFKASTGTEKYFLARLLGIPFGTDPEEDVPAKREVLAGPESTEPKVDPIDGGRVTYLTGRISEAQIPISRVRALLNEATGHEAVPATASVGEVLGAIKTLLPRHADEFEAGLEAWENRKPTEGTATNGALAHA